MKRVSLVAALAFLLAVGLAITSVPEIEVNVSLASGYQGLAEVAVDPLDPDSLVVTGWDAGASGPVAWSSVNGGTSFTSTALPLTFDGHAFAEGSEPTVAVDRDGVWYAAYEVHDLDAGDPIDSSVVVARSFNGLLWEAAAIVEDNRGSGASPSVESPHLAVDPSPGGCTSYEGRLALVWVRDTGSDRAVYRSYSSDGGTSWASLSKINDGVSGSEDVWRPRVAFGPDGSVYVAWLDDFQKTIVVDFSDNGGASFTTDVNAAAVTVGCGAGECGEDLGCSGGALHGSTPALAVDVSWSPSRGTVYLGFADEVVPADGMDVWLTSSNDEGATWSPSARINGDATRQQYGPALAAQPLDGDLHAVWYDRRADDVNPDCETEAWHAVSEDGGATWTDETRVSSARSTYDGDPLGEGPHVALVAASTRVYPVWTDRRVSDHEIYLGRIARTGGTHVPGGAIDTDTTWLAADSPFVVTGDVTVEPGATLTIEAGSEVRFATCDDLHSGADTTRVELIVEGILDVAGTSGNEVSFVSGAAAPAPGDWYGIRFQDTFESSDSTVRYATIEHTRYAVRLTSSSPVLEDVEIALAAFNGIVGSARAGVPFSPTSVTVTNAGEPVSLSNVSGTWTDVTLVDSSGEAGSIGGGNLDLRLVGMIVSNNTVGGLTVNLSGGGLEVIQSEFTANGIAGLTIEGNGPRTLVGNDFENNVGNALVVENRQSGWPAVAVYANNFEGNGGYAVRQETLSLPMDARRNWWGALSAEMGSYPANVSGIWDIHDDPALRHVDFRENLGGSVNNGLDVRSYLVFPDGMNENEMVIYGGAVARAGIQRVEISTDGGTTWSDATVEGAAFSMAWAPSPGTYTVQSRVTDMLGTLEAPPDQKIITIGSGPTRGGTMLDDETWGGPGTIELIGDVIVPAGTTLTIDAGTTVHAQYLTDATYGGLDPSRIEIIVEGVLVSDGVIGNEVIWDSSRAGAGALKGDWYGIRYRDTTTDELSIVQATEIAHGVNCLRLEQAAPDVLDSTVSNCSQDGLSGDSGALAKALWRLSGNAFLDNDGDGVDVDGSTEVEVLGTTVTGNGANGMDIDASPNVVTVTDATITNNGGTGLSIASGSTGFRLLDSTIQSNGVDGVYVNGGGDNIRLERLVVSDNVQDGIDVTGGTELVLVKSSVTGNMRGLNVGSPRLVGAYNTISNNTGEGVDGYEGTAIRYTANAGVPAVLGMCDLENDVNYETYLLTNRALNARRNYWGTITTVNMEAGGYPADLPEFWDIHEDGSHGTVDYDNWASSSQAGVAPGDRAAHITWPASGAALTVHSVVVTGVAYARDGIDRVEVCVRTAGDPVCGDGPGDTPYGVVTGKEAWIFEWFPPSSDLFELRARVVDTAEAKSVPDEAISIDATLLGATVAGPVALSGPIIADQTWSGAIELTGDVIVEAGQTLTLLAGTDVKARALVDDRLGGEDTSRIELIVRGNLVTQGTPGVPVTFSSARPLPERRDWFGIRFEATSDEALNDLDSTRVNAAWHGLEFRDTFSAFDDVWSTDNFGIGLYLSHADDTIPASTITGGEFSRNGSHGIYVAAAWGDWLLEGLTAADNEDRGIYFYNCHADGGTLILDELDVLRNALRGVQLRECDRSVELLSSTIDGNAVFGLEAHRPTRVVVRANTVSNQLGSGIILSYPSEVIVSKNTFFGNAVNAQVSDSSGLAQVVFNELGAWTNAGAAGLQFTGGGAATSRNAHFNNFREYAPSAFDVALSNAVAASVNARVNYWDPDTTAEMDANPFPSNITSIEDVEDNAAWGRVDWRAHRSAAVDLSAAQVCGFTNPVDGDALMGAAFNVQGAAAADAGIQEVQIAIDDPGTWYPVVGEELWSYVWTPTESRDYTLYCRVTDDDGVIQAAPSSVTVSVTAANITTSGTLTDDETWAGVVVLTGDVTVPDGITLTIQEGAIIKAMPQSDDQFGGVDTSRIELIIEGTLNLQGSDASPVTFTSNRTLPAVPVAGDWYGIRLTDTADSTVSIHDAVIEAGVRGIRGYVGSHHDVVDCAIRDMTEYGIYMEFGAGDRDVADEGISISHNTIERIGSTGIYLDNNGSNATWNDAVHRANGNTIDEIGSRAIDLRPSRMDRTEVSGNVVSDGTEGIYTRGTNDPAQANYFDVTGNQISDMSSNGYSQYSGRTTLIEGNTIIGGFRGIYTSAVPEAHVVNNVLSGGTGSGIFVSGTGDLGYIHRNSVTGYAGDGIVTDALGGLVALYNTVSGSGGDAFQLTANNATAVPRVHWNNIDGSTEYDIRTGGYVGADMRRNHWAETNGEMQAEGYPSDISEIWDIEDDVQRGRVDYRGVENLAIDTNVSLESRFVWPFDGDTLSSRTITLEGTAYADSGVQLVEVSTDGGMTWLPTAGTEFWTYSFTPAADGLQTFRCRVTDADSNVEATPDAVTITFDSTLPTTEGTVPDDETWSGPAPVVLTGDVIVPAGTTLTIDPGTTIRVQPLADNSWGGVDLARIELIVEGTLNLGGSAASPVTFTSDRTPDPAPGDWYGIRLTDTADSGVTIHDLVVEFGVRGIQSTPGSHQDVVDCVVRDMTEDGIWLEFGTGVRDAGDPGMTVSGNTVERTGTSHRGVHLRSAGSDPSWDTAVHLVEGNTTADTGNYGLYVYPGCAELLTVTGNDVSNATDGIHVAGTRSTACTNHMDLVDNLVSGASREGIYQGSGLTSLIEGNTVTAGLRGIRAYQTLDTRIENNDLIGGTGAGITASGGTSESHIFVMRNRITDHGGGGLSTVNLTELVALYNTIDNVGGNAVAMTVYTSNPIPRVHWNNIEGSTGYDASLANYGGADLRRNYWSGTNAEMLAEGYPSEISEIWDIEDDTARARIDYRGVESFTIDTNVTLESLFVWPFDGDQISRRAITVEGTAYAEAGIQLVEVSTDGGTTWLPASGTDFWTFSFTPSVDGLQTFLCRVTDAGANVESTPDAVTVTFDSTVPTTEGSLPGNETWSGPDPIVLTGDVVVPAGTTLTIDPGTTIQLQPMADNLRSGVDTSRIELIVEGTLIAEGSGPQSILMTSDSSTPDKGHWYGIRYDGSRRPLPGLRGLGVEWAVTGISDSSSVGTPDLDLVEIRQMTQHGIHASSASDGAVDWTMTDVRISEIDAVGAWFDTGDVGVSVVIEEFDIGDVGTQALWVQLDSTEDLMIRDSAFATSSNSDTVRVQGRGVVSLETVTIEHPYVAAGSSLYVYAGGAPGIVSIDDSEITGGFRSVHLERVEDATIRRTLISGGTRGVDLQGYQTIIVDALIENSRISDVITNGVQVGVQANATLHYNDLFNIGGYTVNNQSPYDLDASANYWGEDTETEMNAKGCEGNIDTIYDWHDNGSMGDVTYCDYATDPFGDQPLIYLGKNGGQKEVHWNPKADLTYDLIRGDLANLAIAVDVVDLGTVVCEQQADASGMIIDGSPDPTPGQGWFFLMRDHTTPGNYGMDSGGRERVPASGDCP